MSTPNFLPTDSKKGTAWLHCEYSVQYNNPSLVMPLFLAVAINWSGETMGDVGAPKRSSLEPKASVLVEEKTGTPAFSAIDAQAASLLSPSMSAVTPPAMSFWTSVTATATLPGSVSAVNWTG